MEEMVVSPAILFLFLLLYLSDVQDVIISPPVKIGWFYRYTIYIEDISKK